jgi:hypothetical protein
MFSPDAVNSNNEIHALALEHWRKKLVDEMSVDELTRRRLEERFNKKGRPLVWPIPW